MQRFDVRDLAPTRWKNGGGATREIAVWPPGATTDDFGWRASVATIDQDGAFSVFPGVDRHIMLLAGAGVQLHGDAINHNLATRWQPFAFSGDEPLTCTLLNPTEPSTDFNIMTRRSQWRAEVQVLEKTTTLARADAGVCLVLAGRWRVDDALLTPEQGVWWTTPQPALTLHALDNNAHLVHVLLHLLHRLEPTP